MPLTAGIGTSMEDMEELLVFYEEIYYWAMGNDIEELYNDTGRSIDLLEDTAFFPEDFPRLLQMIDNIRKRIAGMPDQWDEFLATELDPEVRDIFVPVDKARFSAFLDQFEDMVKKAETSGKNIYFKSDNPIVSLGKEIQVGF